jgi:hypothetical protein
MTDLLVKTLPHIVASIYSPEDAPVTRINFIAYYQYVAFIDRDAGCVPSPQ